MKQAAEAYRTHGSMSAAARAIGIPNATMQNRIEAARLAGLLEDMKAAPTGLNVEQAGQTMDVSSRSSTLRTLDDVLKAARCDLKSWMVDRHVVNKWDMGAKLPDGTIATQELWQIKVWLKRRPFDDPATIGPLVLKELRTVRAMPARRKPAKARTVARKDAPALEISVPDLHMGKLAWAPETGENYDMGRAEQAFEHVVEKLLALAKPFDVGRVLLPIGNDLLHVDHPENTTTAGTRQDADSRWAKMFVRTRALMVRAVERLLEHAPAVDVLIIPGNHDRVSCFSLGEVLAAWFHREKRVTVDNAPTLRKYRMVGTSLIGWTHGSEEKHADLPLIMAREKPQEFAACQHHEWHLGHLHCKRETRHTAGNTHGGVVVRVLPSLSGTDGWHHRMGYVGGIKAAQAFVWDQRDGCVATYTASPPEEVYK
jgi:hypothetical protein